MNITETIGSIAIVLGIGIALTALYLQLKSIWVHNSLRSRHESPEVHSYVPPETKGFFWNSLSPTPAFSAPINFQAIGVFQNNLGNFEYSTDYNASNPLYQLRIFPNATSEYQPVFLHPTMQNYWSLAQPVVTPTQPFGLVPTSAVSAWNPALNWWRLGGNLPQIAETGYLEKLDQLRRDYNSRYEQIFQSYTEGASPQEIAETFHLQLNTVYPLLEGMKMRKIMEENSEINKPNQS